MHLLQPEITLPVDIDSAFPRQCTLVPLRSDTWPRDKVLVCTLVQLTDFHMSHIVSHAVRLRDPS